MVATETSQQGPCYVNVADDTWNDFNLKALLVDHGGSTAVNWADIECRWWLEFVKKLNSGMTFAS